MFIRFPVLPLLGAVLLLVVMFRGRIAHTWPRREDLPRFVLCALVGHVVHISAVMYGMNLSTAVLLVAGADLPAALHARASSPGSAPSACAAQQIAGTLVAFAGIALFLSDKFAARLLARRPGRPDAAGRRGASFSAYTVLVAAARRALRPAHRALVHAALLRAAHARSSPAPSSPTSGARATRRRSGRRCSGRWWCPRSSAG